jgi:two-component system, OmpR family, KDP operon response regulator KdpE
MALPLNLRTRMVVSTRALVIEDDPIYARLLRLTLEGSGYNVTIASSGQAGLDALEELAPEVIILDVGLPDMDGYQVCRQVRSESDVPIIMLTSRSEERHKVQGLMEGADDYVTKPFGAAELLARLASVLRRSRLREEAASPGRLVAGELTIDIGAHRVLRDGEPVPLTATEFKLLGVLVRNVGRVLVSDELLRLAWGPGYEGDATLLRTTIRRLRQKLGEPSEGGLIQNVRGIGYVFEPPRA